MTTEYAALARRFPTLKHLAGAYLHQDWYVEYVGDPWLAVLDLASEFEWRTGGELLAEVESLLRDVGSESDLKGLMKEFYLAYNPVPDHGSYRAWLTEMKRRLEIGPEAFPTRAPYSGHRPPRHSATFPDQDLAEEALGTLIEANADQVTAWLEGPDKLLFLEGVHHRVAGRSGDLLHGIHDVRGVKVVLRQDASMPDGFLVVTGYPQPERPARGPAAPGLRQLSGAYFHQDWFEEYGGEAAAVAAFVEESPTVAPLLPAEVEELISSVRGDEQAVGAALDKMGCEFQVQDDETYTGWLRDVARRVREAQEG
ncbi:MAG TPA: contact-dependent growth inhibition system immunity protein [Actinomycetes bacterium]|nr:contact-dependent growth inhibition system immunity protein [Actinomycetes bacterium]